METIYTVTRRYTFEAAHFLPLVREGHKCKRMHGHNYEIEVSIQGLLNKAGFVIDFWDLDNVVQPTVEDIDHRVLNDIYGLENPTAENIANWFRSRISASLPENLTVTRIRCFETKDCWADVTG